MRKLTKIFGLVLIAAFTVIIAVCAAACGDGEKREEWEIYAGTYKFSKMEMTIQGSGINQSVTINAGESYAGLSYTGDTMVIELKPDGKATISSSISSIESEANLTWRVEDGKLIFPETTTTGMDMSISENTIEYGMTLSVSGMTTTSKYILEKV